MVWRTVARNPDGTPLFILDVEPSLVVSTAIGAAVVGTLAALAKANGLPLNAMLKPGQVLTIPSASAPSAAPKAAAPKAAPAPAPTFAPLKLVPLTGTAPAPVAAPDKK